MLRWSYRDLSERRSISGTVASTGVSKRRASPIVGRQLGRMDSGVSRMHFSRRHRRAHGRHRGKVIRERVARSKRAS